MLRQLRTLGSLLLCFSASAASAQTDPDFAASRDEAIKFLAELVKIDTSNPPGNEARARVRYRWLSRAGTCAAESLSGCPTIPIMQAGATDSAQLRARGVKVYDIGTVMSQDDEKRIHGNDERIEIAGFGKFVEFLYVATLEIAGAK